MPLNKPTSELSADEFLCCSFMEYTAEKLHNYADQVEIKTLFSMLRLLIKGNSRFAKPEAFNRYQKSHSSTGLSINNSLGKLINLFKNKPVSQPLAANLIALVQEILDGSNLQYISCLRGFRDEENRDLVMHLLHRKYNSLNSFALNNLVLTWIQLSEEHPGIEDNNSMRLADYLLCYSVESYNHISTILNIYLKPNLYIASILANTLHRELDFEAIKIAITNIIEQSDNSGDIVYYLRSTGLDFANPDTTSVNFMTLDRLLKMISRNVPNPNLLDQLRKKHLDIKEEDITGIVEYMNKNEVTDTDLELLGATLSICTPEKQHRIISNLLKKSYSIADKLLSYIILSPEDSNHYLIHQFREIIRSSIKKSPVPVFSRIRQLHSQTELSIEDIKELIESPEQVGIGAFNAYFMGIACTTLTLEQRVYLAQNLMSLNYKLGLTCLRKFLDVLKAGSNSLGMLGNFNKDELNVPIVTDKRQTDWLHGKLHSLFGLLRVNQKTAPNQEDHHLSSLQKKLSILDRNEDITKAVIPVQSALMVGVRARIHSKHYLDATYEPDLYKPVYLDEEFSNRLPGLLAKLDYISHIIHISNSAYLHQLLDQGIMSRKLLDSTRTPYVASSLDKEKEPADYDTICCGIGDVDHLALQNANAERPPIKLVIELKALLKENPSMLGQVYVKEHDLMWTSKPDSKEIIKTTDLGRDHTQFAMGVIPEGFNNPIRIGEIELGIYRNSCGVKFVIGRDKYIVHYQYNRQDYTVQTQEIKEKHRIEEEVVEHNFGQTLFYGDPNLLEQFFVMQFFRHVEKLPKLRSILYPQLATLSDYELIHCFNQIGQNLSSGAEFNYQRGMFIPINALEEVHILPGFTVPEKHSVTYGCNSIFAQAKNQLMVITSSDILAAVQGNRMPQLEQFAKVIPNLFNSARFVRYLISQAQIDTPAYNWLANILETRFVIEPLNAPKLREISSPGKHCISN